VTRTIQTDRPRARVAAVLVAAGFALGLAGSILTTAAAPADGSVAVDTFQFMPRELDVKAGTKVIWTNQDDVTHTVTSGTPEQRSDLFNATLNGKGARFEFTFARGGTFTYFCNRHQQMRGTIKVSE
jgi:plastocyanin